ncbi:hypothetical protein [Nonomuraea sp. NPDC050786]|uniref:hypothetical protein n=1 Tax=Nonomuraea sp. NPDC050786 TaxID=3154840 RepID=UPI0033C166D1
MRACVPPFRAGADRPDGTLGTLHHAATGEVLSWSGASGLTWVAALAESGYVAAAERTGEGTGAARRLDLARRAADGDLQRSRGLCPAGSDAYRWRGAAR